MILFTNSLTATFSWLLLVFVSICILWSSALFRKGGQGSPDRNFFLWLLLNIAAFTAFLFSSYIVALFFTSKYLLSKYFLICTPILTLFLMLCLIKITTLEVRKQLFGSNNCLKTALKGFFYGVAVYPVITGVVWLLGELLARFCGFAVQEQQAYLLVKALRDQKAIFWYLLCIVVVVVPVIEELLFRGFFQEFAKRIFQPTLVAWISGLLFAGFHISTPQGGWNIALMVGLTLFGYMAARLKEVEGALIAPVMAHAAFNLLSVVLLLADK